jgi:proline iminopeptidase
VLCIDALGADSSVFAAYEESLHRKLSPEQTARVREIEARRRAGDVTDAALVERFALVWPHYFARSEPVLPPPGRVGVQASIGTNRSLAEHFDRGTLANGLPEARLPVLFVHGEDDPMPLGGTPSLIPGARVETIPDCGHFPWAEQPAAFRAVVEGLLRSVD